MSEKLTQGDDPKDHVRPYASKGTMVEGHHNFHSRNSLLNETKEMLLEDIACFKDTDPNGYEMCLKRYDYMTKRLLEKNVKFTTLTPQPRDCVAYRGANRRIGATRQDYDTINSAKIGDIITPTRGYAYASHYKFDTYQYMGSPYSAFDGSVKFEPMLIEYRIPKGSQISSNTEHGGEVVFPALSKYKLLSREEKLIEKLDHLTGQPIGSYPYKHVVLEYIPEIPL